MRMSSNCFTRYSLRELLDHQDAIDLERHISELVSQHMADNDSVYLAEAIDECRGEFDELTDITNRRAYAEAAKEMHLQIRASVEEKVRAQIQREAEQQHEEF